MTAAQPCDVRAFLSKSLVTAGGGQTQQSFLHFSLNV